MQDKHFLEMIQTLRQSEELILRANIHNIPDEEKESVAWFLKREYEKEKVNYPNKAPAYDPDAALYAATLLYYTAQLILYREQREEDIDKYYPNYDGATDAAAILSADLCLRFIPHLLKGLTMIDADDALIPILEKRMNTWPYSAIEISNLNYLEINLSEDKCLTNLFIDRVIKFKNRTIAQREPYNSLIKSKLGNYGDTFWSELYILEENE